MASSKSLKISLQGFARPYVENFWLKTNQMIELMNEIHLKTKLNWIESMN